MRSVEMTLLGFRLATTPVAAQNNRTGQSPNLRSR